jgi:glutaminyl-peptide cyclotransferase
VKVQRLNLLPWMVLAFACATASPSPPPDPGQAPFSGALAFAQLEKLVALGPRVAGSPAGAQTRALVRAELEALGLEVHEERFVYTPQPDGTPLELGNLWAEVPGTYPGLYIVATPFDTAPGSGTAPVGANEGASGAAVLLELARTLRDRPLAHTVRLYFLDAELLDPEAAFLGSEHAYLGLEETGVLPDVRLMLYLHQVGDSELEIRRDRLSDRRLRGAFFDVAARGGFGEEFPSAAPYDAKQLGHGVFVSHGFRRVVALSDLRHGGAEIPGEYWRTIDDDAAHCSPESLATVGWVVRAGLERLSERQATIDRIRGVPLLAEKPPDPPLLPAAQTPPAVDGAEPAAERAVPTEAPADPPAAATVE